MSMVSLSATECDYRLNLLSQKFGAITTDVCSGLHFNAMDVLINVVGNGIFIISVVLIGGYINKLRIEEQNYGNAPFSFKNDDYLEPLIEGISGNSNNIGYDNNIVCPQCSGDGIYLGSTCDLCLGSGRVKFNPPKPQILPGDIASNEWTKLIQSKSDTSKLYSNFQNVYFSTTKFSSIVSQ
eukprot:gene6960-9515_t